MLAVGQKSTLLELMIQGESWVKLHTRDGEPRLSWSGLILDPRRVVDFQILAAEWLRRQISFFLVFDFDRIAELGKRDCHVQHNAFRSTNDIHNNTAQVTAGQTILLALVCNY